MKYGAGRRAPHEKATATPTSTRIWKALADPTRRRIFEKLADGASQVGDLASGLPVTRSAVSQHLRVLKDAALVEVRRMGRTRIYSVRSDALAQFSAYREAIGSQMPEDQAPPAPDAKRTMHRDRSATEPASDCDYIDESLVHWPEIWPQYDVQVVSMITRLQVLSRTLARLLAANTARHGLTEGEYFILSTLYRLGRSASATPSELARRSLLSPPGIAKRLDRLQTAGFVTRASNPRDRRSSILRLTPRGQRVVHAITTKQLGCDNAAVFAIPDLELNQLSATLRRLLRELPSPRKGRHSDNGV